MGLVGFVCICVTMIMCVYVFYVIRVCLSSECGNVLVQNTKINALH